MSYNRFSVVVSLLFSSHCLASDICFFARFGGLFASCALASYSSFMSAVLLVCATYLLFRLLFCLAVKLFLFSC